MKTLFDVIRWGLNVNPVAFVSENTTAAAFYGKSLMNNEEAVDKLMLFYYLGSTRMEVASVKYSQQGYNLHAKY